MADLTTLAAVKEYLGLTGTEDDALLSNLITRISGIIEERLDRAISATAGVVDIITSLGSTTLVLKNYPIQVLTSVKVGEDGAFSETIPTSEYWVQLDRGLLHRKNRAIWTPGYRNHEITYDAGFVPIPARFEHGTIRMVAIAFKRKDNILKQSQSLKDGSISIGGVAAGDFTDELKLLGADRARKV